MKYYRKGSEIYGYEEDGSQDHLIEKDMIKLSDEEKDKLINPTKYLTASQQYQLYLSSLKPLSRKQFKLVLLGSGLLDDLELAISNVEDATEKKRIEIEYIESAEFARTSESVKTMLTLINQTEEQINELWEKALAL